MLLSKARLWSQKFYSEPDSIEYGKPLIEKGSIHYPEPDVVEYDRLYKQKALQNLMWLSITRIVSRNMTSFLVLNHERGL